MEYARELNIPYFRGVYMKDQLPNKIQKYESMIINLDNSSGPGTHWVCFFKKDKAINYYDSFGVKPPSELIKYFGKNVIHYNIEKNQNFDQVICGHLCLKFLSTFFI
jgi:hypothetical protein